MAAVAERSSWWHVIRAEAAFDAGRPWRDRNEKPQSSQSVQSWVHPLGSTKTLL